jgi:hypothetical protein
MNTYSFHSPAPTADSFMVMAKSKFLVANSKGEKDENNN